MKIFTAILSFILVAVLSSAASAEHRRHSGYSQHYNKYQGSYGYGGRHYSYRRHGHRDHYLLGGLVLGALLHNTYSRYREPEVIHRTVIYRTRRITNDEDVYAGEKYTSRKLRDSEGRCFELTESEDGKELLKELSAEDCKE